MFGKMKRLEERIRVLESKIRVLESKLEDLRWRSKIEDGPYRDDFFLDEAIKAILKYLDLELCRENAVPEKTVAFKKSLENGK